MRLPQSFSAALGHADVVEETLLDKGCQIADDVLDGTVAIDSGALEEVNSLLASESSVDGSERTPQVLRSTNSRAVSRYSVRTMVEG